MCVCVCVCVCNYNVFLSHLQRCDFLMDLSLHCSFLCIKYRSFLEKVKRSSVTTATISVVTKIIFLIILLQTSHMLLRESVPLFCTGDAAEQLHENPNEKRNKAYICT